jgi:hypothetical protein
MKSKPAVPFLVSDPWKGRAEGFRLSAPFEKVVQQYLAKIVQQPVSSLGMIIVTPVT